jgi:hypothetical protein
MTDKYGIRGQALLKFITDTFHKVLTIKFNICHQGTFVKVVVLVFLLHGIDGLLVDLLETTGDHRRAIRGFIGSTAAWAFVRPTRFRHRGKLGLLVEG